MEPEIKSNDFLLELARTQAELLSLYGQLASAKERFASRLNHASDQLEKLFPVGILPTYNGFGTLHGTLENHNLQKEAHEIAYGFSQLIEHLAMPATATEDIEHIDPPE